jgi:hypothetical protein
MKGELKAGIGAYPRATAVLVLAAAVLPTAPAASGLDFLVPGMPLESVVLNEGSSVSYLVIAEAHGIRDTSVVSLSVMESGPDGTQLEISSSEWPPTEAGTVTVRIELCADAAKMSVPGDIDSCAGSILVRSGGEEFREPTVEEIEDFDIERLFLERAPGLESRDLGIERIDTPAGTFDCEVTEHFRSESGDVDMGGITAERFEEEKSTLCLSPKVPFWGLVLSRVERVSRTRYSGGPRLRESKPKETVTESILISFSSEGRSAAD